MKSLGLVCIASNLVAFAHASFQNTSPLLASSSLLEGDYYKYMTESLEAYKSIYHLSSKICESDDGNKRLLYLKVDDLDNSQITDELLNSFSAKLSIISDHVIFKDHDFNDNGIETAVFSHCDSIDHLETAGKSESEWLAQLSDMDSKVTIVHLTQDIQLTEQLEKISTLDKFENVIIQGKPSFAQDESLINIASQKFKTFIGLQNQKRHDSSSDDDHENIDYEQIEQELKDTFAEVNELLNDETVSIYSDDVSSTYSTAGSSNSTVDDPNSVFDSYGFFSTGIWMCGIVSFFLIWILMTSLGWLNSLQVSYKAFEKQTPVSKKLQ